MADFVVLFAKDSGFVVVVPVADVESFVEDIVKKVAVVVNVVVELDEPGSIRVHVVVATAMKKAVAAVNSVAVAPDVGLIVDIRDAAMKKASKTAVNSASARKNAAIAVIQSSK